MPTFTISVEKKMHVTGVIHVRGDSLVAAKSEAKRRIRDGDLTESDIQWHDPIYEDGSFDITKDIN
jgi:hypothetical protein